MSKQVFSTLFMGLFVSLAAQANLPSPCPTCPKSYVNSSLAESVAVKKKGKGRLPYTLLPQGQFEEEKRPQSPLQKIEASQIQQGLNAQAPQAFKENDRYIQGKPQKKEAILRSSQAPYMPLTGALGRLSDVGRRPSRPPLEPSSPAEMFMPVKPSRN